MGNARDQWIGFNEFEDVVSSLELVALLAKDVATNQTLWKWIIIAMQNAVQAAMVLALAGSDQCGALTSKSQQQTRKWLDNPTNKQPRQQMADYGELLCRVQKPQLMSGPPLVMSAEEIKNLKRLNDELRRDFAHFHPKGWGIHLSYMLNIMPVALTAVEFLLSTQRSPITHLTDEQKTRITNSLATARASFAKI